ncbi:protein disulfide-isomerase A6 homolog [Haliotis rubra]|uniref:protein disulfide-isomerase A6 homolog n=1 Tax=Haliotis rubra TaxID=36100 RepID=UPI001EE50A8A|nr:protein disulfide-isomerase A6 homolog [Haliotis rubra]
MLGWSLYAVSLVATVSCLYSPSDDVVQVTESSFDREVKNYDGIVLVEFYAPWCGHCRSLVPEWKKAAKALKGVVKVAAVDADEHKSLGGQYGIRGFPTIKIFGANKNSPSDYNGGRDAQSIVNEGLSQVKSLVNARLSGKSGGGSSGGSGGKPGNPDDVVELTDNNFEEMVLKSDDMWLVEFFAPWCGHCKSLAPHWAQAATSLKGKVKLGALDATVHTVMASRYGIQGFPTIKMFPKGKKDGAEEYDGGRTASDIIAWATEKAAANVAPPEVVQVTNAQVLKDNCENHQLCIIAILPHILDCQSKCLNDYISILTRLGEKYKRNQWGWVWAEAAAQTAMEEAFGIGGFGYPALAAANSRKMKYSWLKGPFSEQGINEFLRELSFGRGSTAPIKNAKLPAIVDSEPWDGKDGELPVEDDIDLSDVELDDLDKDEL